MKTTWIVGLFFFLSLGCATKSPTQNPNTPNPEAANELQAALQDLESENYTSASIALERLAKKDPASEMDLVVLYNLGVAREGLKQCAKAVDTYRSVARISNKKFLRIEALALYRLGFVYECLGHPQKSIVAFLDARKRRGQLPLDVADAELPARLAAAYASLGRRKEAINFFNEASSGLKRLLARSSSRGKNQILVARTLLAMGKISDTPDAMMFLRMLSMQQPFLLQAVELDVAGESDRAMSELLEAYDKIAKFRPEDLRAYLIEGIKVARELKRLRLPETEPQTRRVFNKVEQVEQDLQRQLSELPGGLPKTSENLKRDSLKKGKSK